MSKVKKGVKLEHISKIYQDPKTGKDFYAVMPVSSTRSRMRITRSWISFFATLRSFRP